MKNFLKWIFSGMAVALSSGGAVVAQDLDAQIAAFADAGINLAAGRSKAELLDSFGEEEFNNDPFALLLFVYGSEVESEPWGRYFSDQVWNFDLEFIQDDKSYVKITQRLALIAGVQDKMSDVSSRVDWDGETVSLNYTLGSIERAFTPKFDGDWADPATVTQIMADIVATTNDGKQFWVADNGQASVLVYLDETSAVALNALSDGLIARWQ